MIGAALSFILILPQYPGRQKIVVKYINAAQSLAGDDFFLDIGNWAPCSAERRVCLSSHVPATLQLCHLASPRLASAAGRLHLTDKS